MQDAGCKMQDAGFRMQDSGFRRQETGGLAGTLDILSLSSSIQKRRASGRMRSNPVSNITVERFVDSARKGLRALPWFNLLVGRSVP